MLILAKSLGTINYFTEGETRELLELKQRLGFADPRLEKEMENCDICANDVFRDSWKVAGIEQRAFAPPPSMRPKTGVAAKSGGDCGCGSTTGACFCHGKGSTAGNQEALVQQITNEVLQALAQR
jgi:L-fuculose-phosphate aldolase